MGLHMCICRCKTLGTSLESTLKSACELVSRQTQLGSLHVWGKEPLCGGREGLEKWPEKKALLSCVEVRVTEGFIKTI